MIYEFIYKKQHFYDKLLVLKEELNTPEAKQMAEIRHGFLEQFIEEWKRECL